jgi:hypothetical protein
MFGDHSHEPSLHTPNGVELVVAQRSPWNHCLSIFDSDPPPAFLTLPAPFLNETDTVLKKRCKKQNKRCVLLQDDGIILSINYGSFLLQDG